LDNKTLEIKEIHRKEDGHHLMKHGSPSLILFHNHPSQSKIGRVDFPSTNDIYLTARLSYPMHVIFTEDGFYIIEKTKTKLEIDTLIDLIATIEIHYSELSNKKITTIVKYLNDLFKGRGLTFDGNSWS
jgi:hypothetical protein